MLKPRLPSPLMSLTSVGSLLQMLNVDVSSRDLDLLRLSDADADSEALASDCSDFAFARRSVVDIMSSTENFRRAHTMRTCCGRSRRAAATSARESPRKWQSFTWAHTHRETRVSRLLPYFLPPSVPNLSILLDSLTELRFYDPLHTK